MPTLRPDTTAILRQEATHRHMVLLLQATTMLHQQAILRRGVLQAILRRVLHLLDIHRQAAILHLLKGHQAMPQHQATTVVRRRLRHMATTPLPNMAHLRLSTGPPPHLEATPMPVPMHKIHTPVVHRQAPMARHRLAGHHPQEATTTTATAAVVIPTRPLLKEVATTGRPGALTPMGAQIQPTHHRVPIHTNNLMEHLLQVAIHTVEAVLMIAIDHIELADDSQGSQPASKAGLLSAALGANMVLRAYVFLCKR